MTITTEIKGEKKEIETYLKIKLGMTFHTKAEKAMSKLLKQDVDLISMTCESGICMSRVPKYVISFASYGPCELPKKPVKKRKRA
jgi:hypothetical protein